jgi:hypothetical protein
MGTIDVIGQQNALILLFFEGEVAGDGTSLT